MRDNYPKEVEDYTGIALFFAFVNLFWIFAFIWVKLGLGAVLAISFWLNHMITKLKQRFQRANMRFSKYGPR